MPFAQPFSVSSEKHEVTKEVVQSDTWSTVNEDTSLAERLHLRYGELQLAISKWGMHNTFHSLRTWELAFLTVTHCASIGRRKDAKGELRADGQSKRAALTYLPELKRDCDETAAPLIYVVRTRRSDSTCRGFAVESEMEETRHRNGQKRITAWLTNNGAIKIVRIQDTPLTTT